MKHYFDFLLTGKKFLSVWLPFYLIVLVPYFVLIFFVGKNEEAVGPWLALAVVVMILGSFIFYFYMGKMFIEHTRYNDQPLLFSGKFSSYIGKVLLGFFLSIITLGVYIAWFTRNIMRFFVDQTTLNGFPFSFKGRGVTLFVILLLTVLPIMVVAFILGSVMAFRGLNSGVADAGISTILIQVITFVVMIPYIYFVYKWMVNVAYEDYRIEWKTKFWPSCLQIFIQMALTIVTLGIYFPLAYLKLYKYFAERTAAESPTKIMNFGYELETGSDFLFVWGQTLLSIITLGIYYPWAIVKIGKRVLSKTYAEVISESTEQLIMPPPLPNMPAVELKEGISGETL